MLQKPGYESRQLLHLLFRVREWYCTKITNFFFQGMREWDGDSLVDAKTTGSKICYSTITCKVFLNRPHGKLGHHCAVRCLILMRSDNRRWAYLVLCIKHTPLSLFLDKHCAYTTHKLYILLLLMLIQFRHDKSRIKKWREN